MLNRIIVIVLSYFPNKLNQTLKRGKSRAKVIWLMLLEWTNVFHKRISRGNWTNLDLLTPDSGPNSLSIFFFVKLNIHAHICKTFTVSSIKKPYFLCELLILFLFCFYNNNILTWLVSLLVIWTYHFTATYIVLQRITNTM